MKISFYSNGTTGYFHEQGKQADIGLDGWLEIYFGYLEMKGIDPTEVELRMPDGRKAKAMVLKGEDGPIWNWQIL